MYTRIFCVLTSILAVAEAIADDSAGKLTRHVERPAAQAGVAGSSSSFQIARIFPAGTGIIEFDYVIDSESGDNLEVYAFGYSAAPLWTMSGLNRGGRKRLTFNLGAQTNIIVRFQYRKDADALHQGRDTVWVDRVVLRGGANGAPLYSTTFDRGQLGMTPVGWTGQGAGGGFRIAAPPVSKSASRPPNQAGGTTSTMERTIFFPVATGGIDFDYFVDSEAGHDFLQLFIDGVQQDLEPEQLGIQGISGLNRSGHLSVPVTFVGNHQIRFQYVKDATGNVGLDTARIDRVRARYGEPFTEEFHDFSGRAATAGVIRHENNGPDEWTGTWIVERSTPHRTYVPPQLPGSKWADGWATYSEVSLDGLIGADYKNPTRMKLENYGNTGILGVDGRLALVTTDQVGATKLNIGLRVQAHSPGVPGENGRLRLFFDAAHLRTLKGTGSCSSAPTLPAPEDRYLDLSYSFSGSASYTPVEQRGNCNAATPWVPTTSTQPPWNFTVVMSEPANDPGFVHIEVEVILPGPVHADQIIGMGMIRENIGGLPAMERLPYVDDAIGPLASDTRSWETIRLQYEHGESERSEDVWDFGVFPKPSRPTIHW